MSPPRTFDWDEARRLRAAGLTYAAIAEKLGCGYDGVSRACMSEKKRKNRDAEAHAYVKRRRATGLYYEYDLCACGSEKDYRVEHCLTCIRERQATFRRRVVAERDSVQAEGERLYKQVIEMRAAGFAYKQIAEATGIERRTASNWVKKKPTRFHAPNGMRTPRLRHTGYRAATPPSQRPVNVALREARREAHAAP